MKVRLEKETAWINEESVTKYFIWADDKCIDMAYDKEAAYRKYEKVKTSYIGSSKEILKEEEV